jgi:hypothetical protein
MPRPPLKYKMYSHHWPLHTGPSPTTNCQSPQLTHRSEVHDGAAVANTRRRVSLLCVNLPPQPGAGNLPQGLRYFPLFLWRKIVVEHSVQSERRTCVVLFILGAR